MKSSWGASCVHRCLLPTPQGLPVDEEVSTVESQVLAVIGKKPTSLKSLPSASATGDGAMTEASAEVAKVEPDDGASTRSGSGAGDGSIERAVLNSVTCPQAWATFTRASKNRKKWPIQLAPEIKSDKQGLFELWLSCNRDLDKLQEVIIEKRIEKETENDSEWQFRKKRDILPMYGGCPDKVAKVVNGAHSIPDEALPDDEEERWYRVRVKVAYSRRDRTLESFAVRGTASVDDAVAQHLMGEGGALGDGLSVQMQGVSEADMAKFLIDQGRAEGSKVSRVKQKEAVNPTTVQQVVEDPVENLKTVMPTLLQQGSKAREFSASVVHHEHGKTMAASMRKHSDEMETLYAQCAQKVKAETLQVASRWHPD